MGQTKRDAIVEELRRLIYLGELPRGSRLPQDELAQRFGSSITPVREALRVLEAESLVVAEPHRGVTVAGINFDKFTSTYIMRRLTEGYAVRRAAIRLSPRDLRRARLLVDEVTEAARNADAVAVSDANRAFHFFLYERCGLPALVAEIEDLWRAFPWDLIIASPEGYRRSHDEHERVLDALGRADSDAAGAAMEDHIRRSYLGLMLRYTGEERADPYDIDND